MSGPQSDQERSLSAAAYVTRREWIAALDTIESLNPRAAPGSDAKCVVDHAQERMLSDLVVLCVRWYLSFKLSFRDLLAMMSERGIMMAHTTILRWVQHYTPEFEKRWKRFSRPIGGSWRMDETYVKVRGEWVYLYGSVANGSVANFRTGILVG
jgi:hypothetical protein